MTVQLHEEIYRPFPNPLGLMSHLLPLHLRTGASHRLQGAKAPGATRGSGARGPAGCPEFSRPRRRSRGRPC